MITTLLITLGALLLAMVGSAALSPRSSGEAEEVAEERARTMEAIADLGFWEGGAALKG
jgi:hypothetical protein